MVEFVPGFAWVRCVIGNGESGVIISDLTLDQCFIRTRWKCPMVCLLQCSLLDFMHCLGAFQCIHFHSLCIVQLYPFASYPCLNRIVRSLAFLS